MVGALVLLFVSSISWMWIIAVMLVRTPESVMTSSMLLLFPMTFVSNIFVDPKTMPEFMQTVVGLNPVTHLTNASRGLMHGNVLGSDVVWVVAESEDGSYRGVCAGGDEALLPGAVDLEPRI